jgi:hypothetical protein
MQKRLSQLVFFLLAFLIKHKIYLPLLLIGFFNIKERSIDGSDHFFFSSAKNKITILALDSNRYRGDLNALASNKRFRVLHMSQKFPGWLLKKFYKDNELKKYINAPKGSPESIAHKNALKFSISFLRYFYSKISVDCVTTVNYRYFEDFNWSKASNIIGVPYIMLYRECLLAVDRIYDEVFLRTRDRFGAFNGSHIIVHNQITKKLFVSSGFAAEEKVSVCGALRMDRLIKDIKSEVSKSKKRKVFTFFYFPHNMSIFGRNGEKVSKEKYNYHSNEWIDRDRLFSDVHNAILELAAGNPDIDFIIKPKLEMVKHKTWQYYETVVKKSDIDVNNLENYKVLPEIDVHQLIMESDIICALQSSTAIESAVANKRVVFPLFYDFLKKPYLNNFSWAKHIELFDVAYDANHFKQLFYEILKEPSVDKEIMHKRISLFEQYFDSFDGLALEKYSQVIEDVVEIKK